MVRQAVDESMATIGTIYPQAPYDFALTARAARYYTTFGRAWNGAFYRVVRAGGGLALMRLASRGTTEAPAIDVSIAATRGTVNPEEALRAAERIVNVTLDLRPFYALAQTDPALRRVVEPLVGLHLLQTESLFEAASITVIEQQIALAAAQRGERWLATWGGEPIDYDGSTFHAFPDPARLANASVEELTPLKITFRRMRVLIALAQLELNESLEGLRALEPEGAYRRLLALNGIGHWTAAWTLTRGLGQFRYVGSADVALRAAVNHYYFGQAGRASPEVTDAIFARYGEHAGLAAFYILMKWAMDRYPRED